MAYSEEQKTELINIICEKISDGMALRNVLKNKDLPDAVTFYSWIDEDKDKLKQYVRATELRSEAIFEDILDIADKQDKDVYINNEGIEVVDNNVIQRSRLMVDARKWHLSKLNPKKYGDKLEVEQTNKGVIQFQNISKQFPDEN